jgi:uncharacterized protein YdhG (YjbR/CyaY superfamily)
VDIGTRRAVGRVSDMKTDQATPRNIDGYIAGFPQDVQAILEKIRATIREAAPDAKEKISYQMPAFTLKGNLVYFAAFKKHIGFYPIPTGIKKFEKELSVYKMGKGSVQFPLDKPIPYSLISKIVKFRVNENLKKAKD